MTGKHRPRLFAALTIGALVLPAAPFAVAGGEIRGTIQTSDDRTLTGPIRWDRNEVYWDDLLNGIRREPKPPKDPDKREFRFSIFGIQIGEPEDPFTSHALAIPFGHLRSLVSEPGLEAKLVLKNGREMTVRSGSTDLGERLREVRIQDTKLGEVVLTWSDIRRVDFAPTADDAKTPGRDGERLYGTVTLEDGESVTGFLAFNADLSLVGDVARGRVDGKSQEIELGRIGRIEFRGDDALVTLRDAQQPLQVESFNLHRGNLSVAVPGLGTVDVDADDLKTLEFAPAPASPRYGDFDGGKRLSGTVHPRRGEPVSGELTWDRDEIYTFDRLDGEVGRLDYAIPFRNIRRIVRKSSRSSEIQLLDDRVLELAGTNDVNDENRGILVHLADGTVREFDWEDLDRVEILHD